MINKYKIKMIDVYYCICKGFPNNFGDIIVKYIIEKISAFTNL